MSCLTSIIDVTSGLNPLGLGHGDSPDEQILGEMDHDRS